LNLPDMNCRNCVHFNLKDLIRTGKYLAKQGHGRCNKQDRILPMAGYWCEAWEPAPAEAVAAREQFWRSR
jgi:hypothetical protein